MPRSPQWTARFALLLAALASGCLDRAAPLDYGDPTSLSTPTSEGGIRAYLVSPGVLDTFHSPEVELVVAAWTEGDALPLEVHVSDPDDNEHAASAQGPVGPEQRFRATVSLLHGKNRLRVRIATRDGSRVRRFDYTALYDGSGPGLRLRLVASHDAANPCGDGTVVRDGITSLRAVCVRGEISTGASPVESGELGLEGAPSQPIDLDSQGHFAAPVMLATNTESYVVATVRDRAGAVTSAREPLIQDSTPPSLVVPLAAGAPLHTEADTLVIKGTVTDDHAVESLALQNGAGNAQSLLLAEAWQTTVRLEPGRNDFVFVATDVAGNESRAKLTVARDRLIRLGPPTAGASQELALDRLALQQLLSEDDQRAIEVVKIGLRPAITQALYAIREPERLGVDTAVWGQPEWNMHRLLNMTPDTSDLRGLSIEELLQIASAVGLPPPRLLADLLGLQVTDYFVDLPVATEVVLDQVIGTHPGIMRDPKTQEPQLSLTMYDILQDLSTLAPRFGPAGGHPGFLAGQSHSNVFEPGFLMSIPLRSNLTEFDGVDASAGRKDYLFRLDGDQALQFDFLSDRFSVVGLVDEPTVDLRLIMGENTAFSGGRHEAAGADSGACRLLPRQRPSLMRPPGKSSTSSRKPHTAPIAASSTAPDIYARSNTTRGSIKNATTIDWDRGWLDIRTSGGIGNPPPPALRMGHAHRGRGDSPARRRDRRGERHNIAFRLDKLPVGLSATELIAALRPTLASQQAELSKRLVGANGLAASGCDFYYVPGDGGAAGFLFFRAKGDSGSPYGYAKPGFFRDAALAERVSASGALAGTADTLHEKVAVHTGDVFYLEDDTGTVYRLEVNTVDTEGLQVRIAPGIAP